MRVIAGTAKGTRLFSPKGRSIRPTSDMVREAIFDKLGESIKDSLVLDLYSGSGALGIEALSRGAKSVTFVDRDSRAIDLLRKNLVKTSLINRSRIIRKGVPAAVKMLSSEGSLFDFVFLDPPYAIASREVRGIIAALGEEILDPKGIAIFEHSKEFEVPLVESVMRIDSRRYGDTEVSYVRRLVDRG